MARISWYGLIGGAALALALVLGAFNLYWGDVNQDEGWYLYTAGLVRQGAWPYRDFAFTQGPLMAWVYAGAYDWVERWGLAGGRLFTALLGLASALVAAGLAGRTGPAGGKLAAMVLAFVLIAGNVYQSYFTTVVKTYSLCALLLVSGLLALSYAGGRGRSAAAFAAGGLLAMAAGTRLSAGVALPVAGLYLLAQRRRLGQGPWLAFGVGGLLILGLWSVPFLWVAPDGFRFGLFEYHSARATGPLLSQLILKAGFISRTVQAYFLTVLLGLARLCIRLVPAGNRESMTRISGLPPRFPLVLWFTVVVISAVHVTAAFPYDDYQVLVFPVFAAALAGAWARGLAGRESGVREEAASGRPDWMARLLALALIGSVASAFSSPINQDWFVLGRDRIWWRLKEQSSLQVLRDLGAWVGSQGRIGDTLLTQDTYLAVEARLPVPPGLEMGPFSYFPDMPTERARRLRVLNRERMRELLEKTPSSLAAFSGYGLAIRSPEILPLSEDEQAELWAIVTRRYQELCQVPDFGQAHTTLRLLRRRDLTGPGAP